MRRLMYVAMTRAAQRFLLVFPDNTIIDEDLIERAVTLAKNHKNLQ